MSELPVWLQVDQPHPLPPRSVEQIKHELALEKATQEANHAVLELEKQSFEIAFDQALEKMAGGTTLTEFCHTYHMAISPVRFRAWMMADPKRKEAYMVAKALWAEALEDELVRISDGVGPDGQPTPDDVPRSTLRITTRKWLMEKSNQKRYGDTKRIEQTVTTTSTIDVSTMSTEDLKRFILRQSGADAIDVDTIEKLINADDE